MPLDNPAACPADGTVYLANAAVSIPGIWIYARQNYVHCVALSGHLSISVQFLREYTPQARRTSVSTASLHLIEAHNF